MRELEKTTWPNHHLSRCVAAAGIRWHVQRSGHGPLLLLVHGTGASTHSWRDVLPILARDFSVLAVDLPGHGFTDRVPAPQSSIGGMSRLLSGLLRQLDANPVYVVGHSAGAALLCRMALDGFISPKLILSINGAFFVHGGPATGLYSSVARLLAGSAVASRFIAWRARNPANIARVIAGTGSSLDATGVDLYARLAGNPKHLGGALDMMGNWDLASLARDLARLRPPLALMAAENDLTIPPNQARQVQALVPRATVYPIPSLGHLAHEEQPARIAREIAAICGAAA